ncbi:MAG: acyl-CoA thioesterase [Fusobacteriaceae bacterium]|nr:acyl-CoA thioesterase [Fusobacteriaceae bacterium]
MYTYSYTIGKEDINYGGHVGNERALLFFQHARMGLFESLGYSELDIGDGVGIIQKVSHVEYARELYDGDSIRVRIDGLKKERASFTLHYTITGGGDVAITGYTQLVAYDYKARKIKRVPAEFLEKVADVIS